MRISPYSVAQGHTPDPATDELYTALATELGKLKLAYLNTADHSGMGGGVVPAALYPALRKAFGGPFILSGGYDATRAEEALEKSQGDLVAFGRPFLGNPRLVTKFKSGAALVQPDFTTLYTPGDKGYTDYPLD
jgi:N-ethylmaleimide reductase